MVQPVKIGKSSLCVLIAFNSATCNGAQETKKHYRANNLNKAYEVMGIQKKWPNSVQIHDDHDQNHNFDWR